MAKTILYLLGLLLVAPVMWIFFCAFQGDLLGGIPASLLEDWTLENFSNLGKSGLSTALANSFTVATASSVLGTVMGLLLSFGLICRRKPLFGTLLTVISGRLLPAAIFLLPQYLLARDIGLTESRLALSIAHSFSSLSVVLILLSPFVLRLHRAYGDQVYMDRVPGRTYLVRILIPLLYRPLGFCLLLTFMLSWTDYLFASLFTVGEGTRTLPVLIGNYITSYATLWGPMYAAVSVSFACSLTFMLLLSVAALWRPRPQAYHQNSRNRSAPAM